MTAWDELKVVLVRLRDEQPGVLMGYPTLELDPGRVPPVPPFWIRLAPWAAATAAELHRQFGDDVEELLQELGPARGSRVRLNGFVHAQDRLPAPQKTRSRLAQVCYGSVTGAEATLPQGRQTSISRPISTTWS